MSWMLSLRAGWALSSTDKLLTAQALLLLPVVATGQRWLSLARIEAIAQAVPRSNRRLVCCERDLGRVGELVTAVSNRLPTQPTCLTRAITTLILLRRRGVAATLCLGARTAGGFAAHAWVRCNGQTISCGDDPTGYAAFRRGES